MAETSTVGLNLTGDFAAQAEAAAAAARKLGAALEYTGGADKEWTAADSLKVMEASAKVAYESMVSGAKKAKKAQEDLMRSLRDTAKASREKAGPNGGWANKLPSSLAAPPPAATAFQKVLGLVNRALGPRAAEGVMKGAVALDKAAPMLKTAGSVVGVAGGAVAAGALALTAAAAAVGYAAVKLGSAVIAMGVESTSRREAQEMVLRRLGGTYDLPIQLAARFGLDQGEAIAKVKQLLGSKFDAATIKQLFKIDVGIDAVLGPEKAKAFLDKMALMVKKGSKATEEAIAGFGEAGVSVDKAWQILAAKLGVSVAVAKGKVKSGAVDMKVALDAVKQAAEQDFGAIAAAMGNYVPAKILHIKSLFSGLFDSMDLGPLKAFLDNVIGALSGGAGGDLKASLQDLFGAISHTLFDPFKGEEGKAKLENMLRGAAQVVRDVADAVREAAPAVAALVDVMGGLAIVARENGTEWAVVKGLVLGVFEPLIGPIRTAWQLLQLLNAVLDAFGGSAEGAADSSEVAGESIGNNLGLGLVGGILGSGGVVASAAGALGGIAAASLKAALGVASPAKVGVFVGDMLGRGVAQGASNDNGVSAAGASIADRAMGGMGGAIGGASAGGAAGAGGPPVIINLHLPPGSPAETQAAAKAGAEEAFRAWQAHARRNARETAA